MRTKPGLLKAGLWAATLLGLIVVAWGGLLFCFLHKFSPNPPREHFPTPANALEAQRQDIEQFSRLVAMDRAFSPAARAEVERRIAVLRGEGAPLESGRFRVALMRITALADNGHTGLDGKGDCVPVRVTWFADGLYVLRARSDYADLLGARVDGIDGRPTGEVLAGLEQLHGGAQGWRRIHAALYIQSPEILYGAGMGSRPDRTTWTLTLPDGSETTRTLPGEGCAGEPNGLMARWLSPEKLPGEPQSWRALFSTDADLPLSLRDFNVPFRRAWIDHGCSLFIQLKAIGDADNRRIHDFLKATAEEMAAHPPCNIILDLRFNTGGDYTKVAHFASRLPDFVPASGRIYIFTAAQTFSAAITTAAFVKQAAAARAIILGEPVGDRLSFYGEGNTGCLAHSGLCVHYATGMHDYAHPCNDWAKCYWLNWLFPVQVKSLDPDETIGATFSDYRARRDPVLERAVARATGR
ncbi:MAG TPA: hypothetical protein VNX02_16790 [Steroidobacteraceae bacterium]|jgi:hypothetical protein|nr:hypothetical protein [Steroidobacteraceae bacterium]